MTTLEVPVPEELRAELQAWRAARGSREKFLAVLAKVPNVPPVPPDTVAE